MILCKRISIFLFTFLFFTTLHLMGQEPHYSQFYANPLYLNPAFAGTNNCPRFTLNFRDQWPAVKGNIMSFSGSYDQHIHAMRSGVGVLVTGDIAGEKGIFRTYNVSAIYNFRVKVTHKFNLQFALQGSYLSSSIHWSEIEFASTYINNSTPDYPIRDNYAPKSQFDAAFGFVGYTPFLYFGFAAHHLFPVKTSFFQNSSNAPVWLPKWTAHIGGKITISQKNKMEISTGDIFFYPNLIFISQGNFHYLHEGFYFNFYPFTIGTWLRHNFKNLDAFIISCGFEYKLLRIGYSYDFSLTKLERMGGAHEVSLQFTIPCDNNNGVGNRSKHKKRLNFPSVECPKF
ncbi:MAG: PorP/SprF family type IX secretion system membrane protein [Lentimicrobiaceae bacterium]|nr:PorP/SprF family type IX secretion system membrane protein [Lentimicrobiaceae bacterium]